MLDFFLVLALCFVVFGSRDRRPRKYHGLEFDARVWKRMEENNRIKEKLT